LAALRYPSIRGVLTTRRSGAHDKKLPVSAAVLPATYAAGTTLHAEVAADSPQRLLRPPTSPPIRTLILQCNIGNHARQNKPEQTPPFAKLHRFELGNLELTCSERRERGRYSTFRYSCSIIGAILRSFSIQGVKQTTIDFCCSDVVVCMDSGFGKRVFADGWRGQL